MSLHPQTAVPVVSQTRAVCCTDDSEQSFAAHTRTDDLPYILSLLGATIRSVQPCNASAAAGHVGLRIAEELRPFVRARLLPRSFRALYVQPASISFPPEGNDRTNTAPSVVSGPAVTSRGIRVKRRRHRSDLASNPRYSFVLRCSNISYIIYSNRTCMTASDRKITNKLFNINKISIAD
ncbi:hypothetical protein AB1N83_012547 [Pleurotus pulmonarius]